MRAFVIFGRDVISVPGSFGMSSSDCSLRLCVLRIGVGRSFPRLRNSDTRSDEGACFSFSHLS